MIAVAALVLALWPVVADAPWKDGVTSAELSEILQAKQKTSSEEKEAERVAKCETVTELMKKSSNPAPLVEVVSTLIENRCLSSP